ncbi:LytR/AlgR family response regulator transcription factor [Crocinitomix algicola]|uniref:LytR/AlgR family response regulator transcription factor n=1 Tax=Crocinitomix algicola TaxID=1740263 RepID=UPI00087292FE|nr:LytTR family DNA-binding domain-containing protein [Crocinitomix algicola]
MRCIIIDDEQLARNLVESYVAKIPFLELAGSYKSGIDALKPLEEEVIDLVITDIQMPDLLGTDLIKSLPIKPLIVFTTAYQDYAIEGFELEAVDYLLKPFGFDRFLKSMHKAKELFEMRHKQETPEFKNNYLTVKADHKLYKIHYADIKYIEGMREYVSFHVPTGRITALMSLKSLESKLPSSTFIRCHKSFIVNANMVNALESGNLLIGDKHIPIGQSYKEKVIASIF